MTPAEPPVPSLVPPSAQAHQRARPLPEGSRRPARDLCSDCGLCDTRWVAYVGQACAFLDQHFEAIERQCHGRSRNLEDEDELYFGVHTSMLTARLRTPLPGAQWTGIVSRIGVRALETGLVDAVLCVQQSPDDRFTPMPILARTPEEVLAARVNKPTLSPNLKVLEQLPGSGIRRLLAIGVGCQVQALRTVEATLPLEALYVLGLPCVDNVSREVCRPSSTVPAGLLTPWCTTNSCRTSGSISATPMGRWRRFPSSASIHLPSRMSSLPAA